MIRISKVFRSSAGLGDKAFLTSLLFPVQGRK